MVRRIAVFLGGLAILSCLSSASAAQVVSAQSDALDLDGLQQAGEQWLPDIDLNEGINLEEGLSAIWDVGSQQIEGIMRKAVRSGVLLLCVVLLCGLAESACRGMQIDKMMDVVSIVGALSIAAVATVDASSLIGMGRQALESMEYFSKMLLPVVTAAAAASGSPGGAAARHLATMLFSDILITVINTLLLPMVYLYIAACVGYTALGNDGLKRAAGTLKWMVTTILSALLIVFMGYLTISGVVAGTADAAAIKAAKFTMSSMVPVVGGIISDAAETVLAGAGLLKNAVGIFGMLVILGICIIPFLYLGIHYLVYKLSAALSGTVSDGRVAGLIDQIGGAFGLVLGMTGACALLLLISMISAVTAAGG